MTMNRYAYQGKVVQLFAKSSSGASMPLSLHKQACDANSQFTGLDYLRKVCLQPFILFFSIFDLRVILILNTLSDLHECIRPTDARRWR